MSETMYWFSTLLFQGNLTIRLIFFILGVLFEKNSETFPQKQVFIVENRFYTH